MTRHDEAVLRAVELGNAIRRERAEGNLQSLAPPTLYGYATFVRMARALPHLKLEQIAVATVLGNASLEDRKHVTRVVNEVFGLQSNDDEDPALGGYLF